MVGRDYNSSYVGLFQFLGGGCIVPAFLTWGYVMEGTPRGDRRRLLKRGALLLGSAVGLGLVSHGGSLPEAGPSKPGVLTLSLEGRDWRLTYPDRKRGIQPQPGERSSSFGQLFQGPMDKVGEFYASSFSFGSPFGPSELSAAAMEVHHFNLGDGTIVGMGTLGGFHDVDSVHAIIGGTGRYEGASGSYVARQSPLELGGDGTAKFDFNITLGRA